VQLLIGVFVQNRILVTGATGVLGKAIVKAAVADGLLVRQGVRNLTKADPAIEAVRLDYADPSTIAPALAGVSAIVLMAPPLDPNAPSELEPVIAAAKTANLRHVVLISAFGVNHNEQAPLRVVEHLVIHSGLPFTIVRPNFLMENFSEGPQAHGVRSQNAIHLAAGDGKTSFVSARDVAAAVVVALQQSLTGKEVDLTGPAALDHVEVARIISGATGRTVVYHELTEEQMLEGARSHGMPESSVAYLGVLYGVVRAGYAGAVAGDFESIAGRAPITFDAFARATAASWR
jgi:uncharacterized protein YbjT (DUF2867 family)